MADWPARSQARWRRVTSRSTPASYHVEAIGEIETEDCVLVIKRIKVTYRLTVAPARHAEVERAHGFHARFCPVARSLAGAIDITTELALR